MANENIWSPDKAPNAYTDEEMRETPVYQRLQDLTGMGDKDVLHFTRVALIQMWAKMHPEEQVIEIVRPVITDHRSHFLSAMWAAMENTIEADPGDVLSYLDIDTDAPQEPELEALRVEVMAAIAEKFNELRQEWRDHPKISKMVCGLCGMETCHGECEDQDRNDEPTGTVIIHQDQDDDPDGLVLIPCPDGKRGCEVLHYGPRQN